MVRLIYGVVLFIGMYYDWRERRIPNYLCLFSAIAGVLICLFTVGVHGWVTLLVSAGLFFVVLFFLWMMGVIGAGDIKLLTAGCFYLRGDMAGFLLWTGISLAVLCLMHMIKRNILIKRLQLFGHYVIDSIGKKQLLKYPFNLETDKEEAGIRLTYGLMSGYVLFILYEMIW